MELFRGCKGTTKRGNTRTPMQWNSEPNAGFTTGTPWIGVNPNYPQINVEAQEEDPDSILNFYKEMVTLRKSDDVFMYGTYDLVQENHPEIYAYTRTLGEKRVLILCNLKGKDTSINLENMSVSSDQLLLANIPVEEHESMTELNFKPFEARIYSLN